MITFDPKCDQCGTHWGTFAFHGGGMMQPNGQPQVRLLCNGCAPMTHEPPTPEILTLQSDMRELQTQHTTLMKSFTELLAIVNKELALGNEDQLEEQYVV